MVNRMPSRLRAAARARAKPATQFIRRFYVRAPLVSRSWTTGPPDFVGVGVQRAGTSWWHSLIEAHPDVNRLTTRIKELHFFDELWAVSADELDVAGYHNLFPRAAGKLIGEWTPRYMYNPWVPPLLRAAAPDARLLVMLRDPVARFQSGLAHARRRRRTLDPDLVADAINRGQYSHQLDVLYTHFPRDSVLVLQLEACVANPSAWWIRTLDHLSLRHVPVPAERPGRRNAAAVPRVKVSDELSETLHSIYQPMASQLQQLAPDIDIDLWPTFSSKT
jgi:hypothetical protein